MQGTEGLQFARGRLLPPTPGYASGNNSTTTVVTPPPPPSPPPGTGAHSMKLRSGGARSGLSHTSFCHRSSFQLHHAPGGGLGARAGPSLAQLAELLREQGRRQARHPRHAQAAPGAARQQLQRLTPCARRPNAYGRTSNRGRHSR